MVHWKSLLCTLGAALLALNAQAREAGPPGYLYITGWYKDAGPQREYNSVVGAVLRTHAYIDHFLGLEGRNLNVLEGDWIPGRIMLIQFPSEGHAERFWWSDRYQEIQKIRAPASALDIAQVDGLPGVTPSMHDEAAYLVYKAEVKDRDTLAREYVPAASELVQVHGGQYLVQASRADQELLEGTLPNASVIIIEFPSVPNMRAFWNSEENQRLSEVRQKTGRWSVAEVLPRPR